MRGVRTRPGRKRVTRLSLLAACQAAFALVLLLCAFAPHNHVVVCTMDRASVDAEASGCECCRAKANAERKGAPTPRPGEDGIRAACPPHCCLDLVLDFEQGPLPKPFTAVLPLARVVATLPMHVDPCGDAGQPWLQPHDTGPPRPDASTALLASTILRL